MTEEDVDTSSSSVVGDLGEVGSGGRLDMLRKDVKEMVGLGGNPLRFTLGRHLKKTLVL